MKKTEALGAVVPNVGSGRQYEAKIAPLNVLSQVQAQEGKDG